MVFQVIATKSISESVAKITIEADKIESARIINRQWQEFNKMSIMNSDFADVQRVMNYEVSDNFSVKRRATVFYILNIMRDIYMASTKSAISEEFSENMLNAQARLLASSEEIVKEILESDRGYDKKFKAIVIKTIDAAVAGMKEKAEPKET